MRFSNDGETWADWQPYVETPNPVNWTLAPGDGEKTVYVMFRDPFGAESAVYSDKIILDTVKPNLSTTNVSEGATVALNGNLTFTFSEDIKAGSNYDGITLTNSLSNPVAIEKIISGATLTIHPVNVLDNNVLYTISIPVNAVYDLHDNELVSGMVYNFLTVPDTEAPDVVADPGGGLFAPDPFNPDSYVRVTLGVTNETQSADIYYTTDGTDPVPGVSTRYTGPIDLTTTTTLKFVGVDMAGNVSPVFSEEYVVDCSAPRAIGSGSSIPVIYGNDIVYLRNGITTYNTLAGGTETMDLDPTWLTLLKDFDPASGRVTFEYIRPGVIPQSGIMVYDIAAKQVVDTVYRNGMQGFNSAISGNRLVYFDPVDGTQKLRRTDTGEETVIGTNNPTILDLNGDRLIFVDARSIVLYDLGAESETVLDQEHAADVRGLTIGPDPDDVYWENGPNDQYGNGAIYHIDLSTGTVNQLVYGSSPYLVGNKLYYEKGLDGQRQIFSLETESGEEEQLTDERTYTYNTAPMFDADVLVFQSGGRLMIRNFDLTPPVVTPSLDEGTYGAPIEVGLEANKADTQIYYTVNGLNPDNSGSFAPYNGSIDINTSTTLQFFGIDSYGRKSAVLEKDYLIAGDTAPPVVTFLAAGGSYNTATSVNLGISEPGTVYYTLDGSTPSPASPQFAAPILVDQMNTTTTLTVYAVDSFGNGAYYSQAYALDNIPPVVDITSPAPGALYNDGPVLLYTSSDGTVTVKVNGTIVDTVYGQPLTNLADGAYTLRVESIDAAGNIGFDTLIFTVDAPPTVAISSPSAGLTANSTPQLVFTVSGGTAVVKVDGQVVSKTSGENLDALADGLHFVQIIASDTTGHTVTDDVYFTVDTTPPEVTVNHPGGNYDSPQTISLSANETAAIYYTTDGTIPGPGSQLYSAPIAINESTELKFYAVDLAGNATTVTTLSYVIENTVPVTGISLNKTSASVGVNSTVTLTAVVAPSDASNKAVTWNSNNPTVATVNNVGVVTGISTGTAVITATTIDGGFTAQCTVTVTAAAPVTPTAPGAVVPTAPVTTAITTMAVINQVTNTQGASVAPEGGTVQTTDAKVVISVPSGALQEAQTLTVTPLSQASVPAVVLKTNAIPVSPVYEFGPNGTNFTKAITITIKFDKASLTQNEIVAPYYLNEQTGVWEVIGSHTVDWAVGTVTFTTGHFSKYAVMATKPVAFTDISTHWAKPIIEEMAGRGIVSGRNATTFAPDERVTRAEFVRMLAGALGLAPQSGSTTFTDVDTKAWYYQWVEAAAKAGIVKGANGKFRPNDRISRQEMAVMIVQALAVKNKILAGEEAVLAGFADTAQVSTWARSDLAKAVKAGIVNGRSTQQLAPLSDATRAEAAVMIKKVLDIIQ